MMTILRNKMQCRFLATLTVFTLVITSLTGQAGNIFTADAAAKTAYTITLDKTINNVSTADKIEDGAILHAWCWSFNTIKNNMKQIAQAGYTSVQTSPAGACVVGNGGSKAFANWYWHYQPTDYTVGNYQLGSESEFAAMCDEAHKYGVKIIVDVVANHMTGDQGSISNNYKSIPNWCHTTKEISNWNSRYEVTQLALMSMPDNNTQNKQVQNYIKNYLKKCLSLGADGFRYDAAKHIELPDDSGFGGDFWPTILNNGAEFQYGEILQDSTSRESAYANYMGVTASSYGMKLRDAAGSNNFSANTVNSLDINAPVNRTVTWVESHDNYANAITDWGSSQWMNDEQIKLAWAVIGARKNGTPLFFSRPVGGGGHSWDNRFPGMSQIGDRGSDLFMDDEVAAVNKFRNAMEGLNEYLRNPNGDTKVLMIERGNKGVTIINSNNYDYDLSSVTNLANGTYNNQTDNNNVFQVSNGRITGKLPARSVVVLYDENKPNTSTCIYFKKPANWGNNVNAYIYSENGSQVQTVKAWPGVSMNYDSSTGKYKVSYKEDLNGAKVIFNDGTNQAPGQSQTGFGVVDGGIFDVNGFTGETIQDNPVVTDTPQPTVTVTPSPSDYGKIFFAKPSSWSSKIYAYIYDESGSKVVTNAAWPGVSMTKESNGEYSVSLDSKVTANSKVIFSDGNSQVPGSGQSGWSVVKNGHYTQNGLVNTSPMPSITVTPSPVNGTITVYYKTSWTNAYIHYQLGSGSWTSAPGVKMQSSSYSGYKTFSIDLGTNSKFTACFNNGNGNWDNNSSNNYIFRAEGKYTVANGVISTGTPK